MADAVSDDDLFMMFLAAPLVLPVAAPLVFGMWDEGREWMIERGFIASADQVVWAVPGWDGAGIGSAHIVLLVCLVVFVTVIGTAVARHQRQKKIDTEGWGTN